MNRTSQIKSLFLLLVFSMHTLVGLACSVGFVVGSKEAHHTTAVKTHSHDKPHQHEAVSSHAHDHGNMTGKAHSHEASVPAHDHSSTNTHDGSDKEDDCCTEQVIKLSLVDKALTSEPAHILPPLTFLEVTLYAYFLTSYDHDFSLLKSKPPNLRSWPLATHTDLRIAIQSFQI